MSLQREPRKPAVSCNQIQTLHFHYPILGTLFQFLFIKNGTDIYCNHPGTCCAIQCSGVSTRCYRYLLVSHASQQNSSPAPAPDPKPTMIDDWAVSVKPNADPTIIKKHIEKMVEVSFSALTLAAIFLLTAQVTLRCRGGGKREFQLLSSAPKPALLKLKSNLLIY